MKQVEKTHSAHALHAPQSYLISRRLAGLCLTAGGMLLALSGCSKPAASAAAEGGEAPAVEVGVIEVVARPLTLSRELPGRTSAHRVAEVRARVDGIIEKRLFEEGGEVEQGQILYEIDAAPYEAVLQSAQASLARAEASLSAASAQVERYKELVERKAVSRQEYDDSVAQVGVYQADIAAAKAAVRAAEIDLGYTKVEAPVSGTIGRSEVTEGAYVQRGTATLLATIRQLDPIYVDVTQPSEQLLSLKQALAAGNLQRNAQEQVPVSLRVDGFDYPQQGTLQFSEVNVDEGTSSVTLRALFPNPDKLLLPGMYVRASIPEAELSEAILVPPRGVGRNTRGEATALVVGQDGVVELRMLEINRSVGNDWLVHSGLQAGDKLIVEGVQKVRPGARAKAIPATIKDSKDAPAN